MGHPYGHYFSSLNEFYFLLPKTMPYVVSVMLHKESSKGT